MKIFELKTSGSVAIGLLISSLIIGSLIIVIWFFGPKNIKNFISKPEQAGESTSRYKCLTTQDGLVPKKVVVIKPQRAKCYSSHSLKASTVANLKFFTFYFVFEEHSDFVKIGSDSFTNQTIGWVKKDDVIFWNTLEAFRPIHTNRSRKPIMVWGEKKDVGIEDKWDYKERTDIKIKPTSMPYPVLHRDNSYYQIALTWISEKNENEVGVAIGWTKLEIGRNGNFFFYKTKSELRKHIDELRFNLNEIIHNEHSDHPIIKLFKEDLRMSIGNGLDVDKKSIGFLKRIADHAPEVPEVFRKHPNEIRRDVEKIRNSIKKLKEFLENNANWNSQGEGWIPIELVPGS